MTAMPQQPQTPRKLELQQEAQIAELNTQRRLQEEERKLKSLELDVLIQKSFVDAQQRFCILASQHRSEFLSLPGGEHCPRCFVINGVISDLTVIGTNVDTDSVTCAACNFHAILPK